MTRYRRAKQVAWRQVAGETVIVHLARKQMLGLNEAGGLVWHALDQERGLDELAAALPAPGDPERRQELTAFLDDLECAGVLERDPRPAAPVGGELPALPPPGAPAVAWREEITRFAGACGTHPGQSDICSQYPTTS